MDAGSYIRSQLIPICMEWMLDFQHEGTEAQRIMVFFHRKDTETQRIMVFYRKGAEAQILNFFPVAPSFLSADCADWCGGFSNNGAGLCVSFFYKDVTALRFLTHKFPPSLHRPIAFVRGLRRLARNHFIRNYDAMLRC